MNPTPESPTTLAHALAALRDDLEAQPPAPPSVLIAAQRAARRTASAAAHARSPTGNRTAAIPAAGWVGRLLGAVGWGPAGARGVAGGWVPWAPWAGAATCAAVLGVSLLLALRPPQMPPVRETVAIPGAGGALPAAQIAGAQGELVPAMHFVPLVSPERMRALAASQSAADGSAAGADTTAWVVTTELPQQRLAEMGLPYDPGHAAETLRAELLVAGSGEVLAVRLLF